MIVHYLTAHQIMYYCKFVKARWPVRRRRKREGEAHRHARKCRKWPHPGSANECSHLHRDTTGRISVCLSLYRSFTASCVGLGKKLRFLFFLVIIYEMTGNWTEELLPHSELHSILHSTAGDATKTATS